MTVAYENRYNDLYVFIQMDNFNIRVVGSFGYCRIGEVAGSNGTKLSMIDPSGGPYISVGTDMGRFDSKWDGRIVKYITSLGEDYELHLEDSNRLRLKKYIDKI